MPIVCAEPKGVGVGDVSVFPGGRDVANDIKHGLAMWDKSRTPESAEAARGIITQAVVNHRAELLRALEFNAREWCDCPKRGFCLTRARSVGRLQCGNCGHTLREATADA